ncbi:alpha/beta hydrolase family protein [Kribbella sp. DT2]|uniref:alpha/beta hydrolase family protein n=1 Tax=Kribbella sp. DT2 TaxID=3393427 RepID=UPI003CF46DD6
MDNDMRYPDYPQWVGNEIWWQESDLRSGRTIIRSCDAEMQQVIDRLPPPWSVRSWLSRSGSSRAWRAVRCGGEKVDGPSVQIVLFIDESTGELLSLQDGEVVPFGPAGWQQGLVVADVCDRAVGSAVLVSVLRVADRSWQIVAVPSDDGRSVARLHRSNSPILNLSVSEGLRRVAWMRPGTRDPWSFSTIVTAQISSASELSLSSVKDIPRFEDETQHSPQWLDDQRLVYCGDRDGGQLLWIWDGNLPARPVPVAGGDVGREPWAAGQAAFCLVRRGNGLEAVTTVGGGSRLLSVDLLRSPLVEVTTTGYARIENRWSRGGVSVARSGDGSRTVIRVVEGTAVPVGVGTETRVAAPDVIEFQSVSGVRVEGYLHQPIGACQSPPPLVVNVHGGPNSEVPSWENHVVRAIRQMGIAVFTPAVVGSLGFGKKHRDAAYGLWSTEYARDCVVATRALLALREFDAERVAIRGVSSGGWAALHCMCDGSGLFRCAVVQSAPTSAQVLLSAGTHWQRRHVESLLGDFRASDDAEPDVSRLAGPVLQIHGAGDRSIPVASIQDFAARAAQVQPASRLAILDAEGHQFVEPESIVVVKQMEVDFFATNLMR